MRNKLRYRQLKFAEMTIHPEVDNDSTRYKKWLKKKADILEEIEQYEHELESVKAKLKGISKHIAWAELKDEDKFFRLLPGRKRLMDTVRMIAYRAETAMAGMMTGPTIDMVAARQLLQDLFVNDADLLLEPETKILRVRYTTPQGRPLIDPLNNY